VDRPALMNYMQYRSKAFDQERVGAALNRMDRETRQRLIDDYVREEALYREASALELERNDYIIKRRLIQKVEFITKGFVSAASEMTNEDVEAYFEAHRSEYYIEPSITFTHVFFNSEKRSDEETFALAEDGITDLLRQKVAFSDAVKYGDRFLYHVNYVERVPEFVASHFSAKMSEQLFSAETPVGQWSGPFESPYGHHLVLISNRQEGRDATLKEISDRVRSDTAQYILKKKSEEAIQLVVDQYTVKVEIK
jgi:hypothetical protein